MPHLIDARVLVREFAETDSRMPLLVFSLLSIYFAHGPFRFDAAQIAERLMELNQKSRANAQEIAALQPDLERFFIDTDEGWAPRPGVLAFESERPIGDAHAGALPGDLTAH